MPKSQIDKIQSEPKDLIRFEQDGIEVYIDKTTGETFASISGAARMVGKTAETVRRFSSSRNFELQQVQIDTGYGKKLVSLLTEDRILEVLEKYNKERLKQFALLGVRVAIHQIAGFQYQQQAKLNLGKSLKEQVLSLHYDDITRLTAFLSLPKEREEQHYHLIHHMSIEVIDLLLGLDSRIKRGLFMFLRVSDLERVLQTNLLFRNARIMSNAPKAELANIEQKCDDQKLQIMAILSDDSAATKAEILNWLERLES